MVPSTTIRVALDVDRHEEQWEWLRKRLAARLQNKKPSVASLCQAYEEATGTCIGCD
jgi:hypothetical protein